jgi:hypothetical protein
MFGFLFLFALYFFSKFDHLIPMFGFADVHFNHRGVMQLLLGEDARNNNEGFRFNRDGGRREWVSTIDDIIDYNEGVTEADIDEEYIRDLITLALKNGAEMKPQGRGGSDRGSGGGDEEGCGGYGK